MLFDSLDFWLFFAATLVLLAFSSGASRKLLLVLLSFIFYGFWDVRFVALLFASLLLNYLLGLVGSKGNKRVVTVAVVVNLVLLGFFKYYNFFVASFAAAFHVSPDSAVLHVILPVGISFFTFEGIAYAIDIYRGELAAVRNPLNFAVFITFFPHLVAGPIIRPSDFFPQMSHSEDVTPVDIRWGIKEVLKGLFKKVVLADSFGPLADSFFGNGHASTQVPAIVGVLAFSLQIYFDFSGYTDIARGCAKLLGYSFPPNFERPYLSTNIAEFWRKWHISLSSWLRDYLYFPLGGNRSGAFRTNLNLLTVMVLGGLWHGASWNFVIWGAYHGAMLVTHRGWRNLLSRWPGAKSVADSPWLHPVWTAMTFAVVTIGWIPFRAQGVPLMLETIEGLQNSAGSWLTLVPRHFILIGAASILFCLVDRHRRVQLWLVQRASSLTFSLWGGVTLFAMEALAHTELKATFIYFQF